MICVTARSDGFGRLVSRENAGVNHQTAKAIGGWASDATYRYAGTERIALPSSAFPSIPKLSSLVSTDEPKRSERRF